MAGHGTGQILAIGAGLCAACASVFAKLAVTSGVVLEVCQNIIRLVTADQQSTSESANQRSSVQQNVWADFCVPVRLEDDIQFICAIKMKPYFVTLNLINAGR